MAAKSRKDIRKHPKQERAKHTVDAILRATAHILAEHGYEGASTNRIAEKAGVSIGSLYQYFPDKESLVVAVLMQLHTHDRELIEERLQTLKNATLEEIVRSIVVALLAAFSERVKLRRVMFYETPRKRRLEQVNALKEYLVERMHGFLRARPEYSQRDDLEMKLYILLNSVEAVLNSASLEPEKYLSPAVLQDQLCKLTVRFLETP